MLGNAHLDELQWFKRGEPKKESSRGNIKENAISNHFAEMYYLFPTVLTFRLPCRLSFHRKYQNSYPQDEYSLAVIIIGAFRSIMRSELSLHSRAHVDGM